MLYQGAKRFSAGNSRDANFLSGHHAGVHFLVRQLPLSYSLVSDPNKLTGSLS